MFIPFAAEAAGDTIQVASRYIEPAMKVTVITPMGYGDPGNADKRYPTVYLLNGHGGDYRDWPAKVGPAIDSLATEYGMILVCPSGRNSWYFDSKRNPKMQMESFITRDLVPTIDSLYRTIPEPSKRAITGLSMGGHGGLWLGLRHSDIWGNAGSTSGGVDIRPFPNNWNIKDNLGTIEAHPEVWEQSTVISLVPTLKAGEQNIIFDCGVDDFFYKVNVNLHDELVKAGIPHDFISRPGGHNNKYWANSILYQLLYFHTKFMK